MNPEDEYFDEAEEQAHAAMADADVPKDAISISIDPYALRAVVDLAANRLVDKLAKVVQQDVEKRVAKLWQETLQAKCAALAEERIQKILLTPRQKTDQWGNPMGEPVSPVDVVLAGWHDYLTAKVNAKGEPASGGYGNSGSITRADFLLRTHGIAHIQEAAKEAVDKIGKEARAQVQEAVVRFVTSQMAPRIELKA